jgi:peptidoglycan-associated lipoprotein
MNRPCLTWIVTLFLAMTLGGLGCSKRVAAPLAAAPPPPSSPPPPAAPGVTLSADRTTITAGQSVTLAWQSTNATTVTINPVVGAVPASGNRQVSPVATTTYTAAASGPGGTARSSGIVITVNPVPARPVAAAPPPPVRPPALTPDQVFAQTMTPILFEYDKSNIRADQERRLLTIAAWLKQTAGESFTIDGHADERGGQEYNIALGDERAAAVRKFLAAQGIAESRMKTISFGEERPACRAQTEECWQMNRRAGFQRTR